MKTIFAIILICVVTSCERSDNSNESYLDYLRNKAIISIVIQNNTKFFLTARHCDTCYVEPQMSYIPSITELTIVHDSGFNNYFSSLVSASLHSDKNGKVYLLRRNQLYQVSEDGDTDEVLNTGDYQFVNFTADPDGNLWMWNYTYAAFWNKTSLVLFNQLDPYLQENMIMGMTVDNDGTLWICTDSNLIKYNGIDFTVFLYDEIPGANRYSRMTNPIAFSDGSMWFEFNSDTTSSILRLKDNEWTYSFPDTTNYSNLYLDDPGTLWSVNYHYSFDMFENLTLSLVTLKYYENGSWNLIDIGDIKSRIFSVNSDEEKIYIGTVEGLIEKLK